MKSEIKIIAQLDQDPRVCHLTADCDLFANGAAQPLLQKIIGVPGVCGVRLSDDRTIDVEKGGAGDWQDLSKAIGRMIREHLKAKAPDPRLKGPKGHTKFGATLESLWACHRQLDRFSVRVKSGLQRERTRALWALAATSLFGLFAAEHFADLLFGVLSGLTAGLGAYFTKRASSPEREHQWFRSRALAEQTKSEGVKFLVRVEPYDQEDAVAKLAELTQKVRKDMAEIGEFDDLDKADRLRGLPDDWLTMDDYLLDRIKDQSDWYGRKSRQHHKESERLKQILILFGIATAALGAASVFVGQFPGGTPDLPANQMEWEQFDLLLRSWGLGGVAEAVKARNALAIVAIRALKLLGSAGWIPVLTSLTGAVTTFQYQNRLDFTALMYKQTRGKLEAALAEWSDQVPEADKPARHGEFVLRFEQILNQEHAQWIEELDKGSSSGASMGGMSGGGPIL